MQTSIRVKETLYLELRVVFSSFIYLF